MAREKKRAEQVQGKGHNGGSGPGQVIWATVGLLGENPINYGYTHNRIICKIYHIDEVLAHLLPHIGPQTRLIVL